MQDELRPAAPESKKRRLLKWLVIALLVLGVLVAGSWFGWQKFHDSSPIPKNIRQSVNFPLYYPKPLPTGFKLDKNSFSSTSQVVTYTVIYNGTNHLAISVQPKPPSMDFDSLFGNVDQNFSTPIGQAVIANAPGNRTTASILTDRSWIILNTTGSIGDSALQQLIQNFVLAN